MKAFIFRKKFVASNLFFFSVNKVIFEFFSSVLYVCLLFFFLFFVFVRVEFYFSCLLHGFYSGIFDQKHFRFCATNPFASFNLHKRFSFCITTMHDFPNKFWQCSLILAPGWTLHISNSTVFSFWLAI